MVNLKRIMTVALFLPAFAHATPTYVPGVSTKITKIDTYHYGAAEGDIRILVADTVPGCDAGYFITGDNLGVEKGLSIALSAFHTDASVIIGGQSGIDWSGSSNPNYCQVHAITLVK